MSLNLNHILDQITTPVSFGKPNTRQVKKYFKIFINFNYIAGFIYAFYFFITTSRAENMFERRLWAFECWLILSFYGLFIYLFYLEKTALENQRGLYRFMHIQAFEIIDQPAKKVIAWFKSLEKNPSKYRFDTHQGVEVLEGSLLKQGSKFATREKFLFVTIGLSFKTIKVEENMFEFKVIEPKLIKKLGVRGKFEVLPVSDFQSRLDLIVYSRAKTFFTRIAVALLLYLSPIRVIVSRQLFKEIRFVKKQVESK
ncbi:MAG TPA: hypothetical protein DDX29_11315 [Clostridiales bacterium]|nr:MAG: Bet v1-like [Microgenomates bacterium 39_7]HBH13683.1 hypothetical protein [Clostridiales bacterium]